jgi:hypothetical protein
VSTCKGKGKFFLEVFLTEQHVMKAYWGSESIAPLVL